MSLLQYIFKRILFAIPTLFVQITVVFFCSKWMPGNPFIYRLNFAHLDADQLRTYYDNLRLYGFDLPITTQYYRFLRNLFTGDWGVSYFIAPDVPVWSIIKARLPITIELLLISIPFSYVVGSFLGKLFSMKFGEKKEQAFRLLTLAGGAIPIIFFSLFLILAIEHSPLYRFHAGLASYNVGDPGRITGFRILDSILTGEWKILADTLLHYILPVMTLSIPIILMVMRQTRASMLDVLKLDYIRTARAKGCSNRLIKNKHAFRNAMVPTITYLGMSFNLYLINCVLIENIYQLPGFTSLFINSIRYTDYNVIVACATIIVVFSVCVSLLIDLVYILVDPRIRFK